MTQQIELEKIRTYLTVLAEDIYVDNKNGDFDINKHAENVLLKILNVAYDLELKNLNYEKRINYPGIDLHDASKRVAFQITSTGDVDKVIDSLKKCVKYGFDSSYDYLYFYFLKEKKSNVKVENRRITKELGKFNPSNIFFLDNAELLKHLNKLNDMGKYEEIRKLLEKQYPMVSFDKKNAFRDGICQKRISGVYGLKSFVHRMIIRLSKSTSSEVTYKGLIIIARLLQRLFFEPNRRPAAIACHNSRLYGRLPLAKVVFFVYSHFASDNKNPHR